MTDKLIAHLADIFGDDVIKSLTNGATRSELLEIKPYDQIKHFINKD